MPGSLDRSHHDFDAKELSADPTGFDSFDTDASVGSQTAEAITCPDRSRSSCGGQLILQTVDSASLDRQAKLERNLAHRIASKLVSSLALAIVARHLCPQRADDHFSDAADFGCSP